MQPLLCDNASQHFRHHPGHHGAFREFGAGARLDFDSLALGVLVAVVVSKRRIQGCYWVISASVGCQWSVGRSLGLLSRGACLLGLINQCGTRCYLAHGRALESGFKVLLLLTVVPLEGCQDLILLCL